MKAKIGTFVFTTLALSACGSAKKDRDQGSTISSTSASNNYSIDMYGNRTSIFVSEYNAVVTSVNDARRALWQRCNSAETNTKL